MNRTILIVICDFLLVSLLAFSTVDINRAVQPNGARTMADMTGPAATNHVGGQQDLGDVMRLALEQERKNQTALESQLTQSRATASQQLQAAQQQLRSRDEQLQTRESQLRAREEESARLQQQQSSLMQQMNAAQSNINQLNQQLHAASTEVVLTKEQRAAQEAEARKEMQKEAALQAQLAALQQSNQLAFAEREQMASQLQLSESQKQAAAAQLARAEEDLNVQRQENAQLSEGVKALAVKSSELTQEIRANQPLTPNTIFDTLATNRVDLSFYGVRPGFFGTDTTKYKQAQTILATDGTNIFALCHLQDTLLSLWEPGAAWKVLTGTIAHGPAVESLNSLSFYSLDPRVALLPVSPETARELGTKVYHLARDPYKFQDAVVVGPRQGYYGECQFQIDLSAPQYLKMDHNTLKGLFGKFNPSTGDLVFSRNGDLLGVMANGTYCIIIQGFQYIATVTLGSDTRAEPISQTLSSLYGTVMGLPYKLQ